MILFFFRELNIDHLLFFFLLEVKQDSAFPDLGVLMNSGSFSGLSSEEAKKQIVEEAKKLGFGGVVDVFRLHDWLISRQRYWGAPIPLIHCNNCGTVPVPEDQLPVILPEGLKLSRKGSPLSQVEEFLHIDCPKFEKKNFFFLQVS